MKFDKLKESLRADGAPAESTLRDSQIGDVYIWLVKRGSKYSVLRMQAPSPVDPKFKKSEKTLFSGDEDAATKKFHEVVQKTIQDL